MNRMSAATVIGLLIIALGFSCLTGWLLHLPALIHLFTPVNNNMTFNAALCFTLTGISLLLANNPPWANKKLQTLCGALIALIAGLTTTEYLTHQSLGIDQLFMEAWLPDFNPNPGRMAINSAFAFTLTGITIMLLSIARYRLCALLVQAGVFFICLIGASALFGHIANMDIFFSWQGKSQMSANTAAGLTLVGIGLFLTWKNSDNFQLFYKSSEDKKIFLLNAIILFFIATLIGMSGFAISAKESESTFKTFIQQSLSDKVKLLQENIQQASLEMNALLHTGNLPSLLASENHSLLFNTSFSYLQIKNGSGKLLFSSGKIADNNQRTIPLYLPPYQAKLIYQHGFLIQLAKDGIIAEWPLHEFTNLFSSQNTQNNKELFLCYLSPNAQVNCFSPYTTSTLNTNQIPYNEIQKLIDDISSSQQGTIKSIGNNTNDTLIAYNPISPLKAGLLLKTNMAEIYSPIYKDLLLLLPLILVSILIGTLILYQRILPLIKKVVEAKKEALATSIRLRTVVNHIPDGIITLNETGEIEDLNPKIPAMFNYSKEECLGKNIHMLMPSSILPLSDIADQQNNSLQVEGTRKSGQTFPLELSITEMPLENQRHFVGIMRDITDRKEAEEKLRNSESQFRLAFDSSAIGMALVSLDGRYMQINPALLKILGYTEGELLHRSFRDITFEEDMKASLEKYHDLLDGKAPQLQLEKRYIHKDGHPIWALLNLAIMCDSKGQQLYIIAQIQDISKQKEAEEQLHFQARHDSLTGLANRFQLEKNLIETIDYAKRYKKHFAVFFLDLDKFKQINDIHGHEAGDVVLKTVANRLQSYSRKSDTIARLGGDEFVLVLDELNTYEEAAAFAERLLSSIIKPIEIRNHKHFISSSIGISFFPTDGADLTTLLKNADEALYKAKDLGRNCYQFCQTDIRLKLNEKMAFVTDLKQALDNQEFILYYLPKMNAASQRISGVEALIRWDSKQYGIVSPEHILPIAEESGFILALGDWIIETACQQVLQQDKAYANLHLAANLSARQFLDKHLVESIKKALCKTGFQPSRLTLEINENLLMQDPLTSAPIINALKELGVCITVDNFGTGYSSLTALQDFHIDSIKIDKSLIKQMTTDSNRGKLASALIALAKHLGIVVIAEGVETQEQFDFLVTEGCHEIQGYYISKPIPAAELTTFLKTYEEKLFTF